jgi:hypothetical protein
MRIWIRNTAILFAILRICDLRTATPRKLRDLRTGTPQKPADLRLRNEPKNLLISNLRTNKKKLRAHLWKFANKRLSPLEVQFKQKL